jgi:uncharacterized protein YbjT (DUF2867 family)
LGASSIPYTVVAPTYFYENLGDLDETSPPRQIADALSAASDRPVGYQQVDLAARSGDIAAMYRYSAVTGRTGAQHAFALIDKQQRRGCLQRPLDLLLEHVNAMS